MSVSTDDPIFQRIQNASDDEVRQVLAGLCIDGVVKGTTNRLFDKLVQKASSPKRGRKQNMAPAPAETQYLICIICRSAYTEEENSPTACRQYHPGTLQFNPDSWHWDEFPREDIVDCQYMRDRNPGGFEWTCCDEYGSRDELVPNGCTPCRHKQGGSKTVQPAERSSESSAAAAASRGGNRRKRRRPEVIVISDDDDSESG